VGKEGIRTTKTIIETTTTLTAKRRVAVRNEVARDREVYPALGLSHLKKKGAEAILIVAVGVAAAVLSLPFLLLAAAAGERETTTIKKRVAEVARILDLVRRLLLPKKAEVVFDRRLEMQIKIHTYAYILLKSIIIRFFLFFLHA
jgi:hypothetical protein